MSTEEARVLDGRLNVRRENGLVILEVVLANEDKVVLQLQPAMAVHVANCIATAAGITRVNDAAAVLIAIEAFGVQAERQFGRTSEYVQGIRGAITRGVDAFCKLKV